MPRCAIGARFARDCVKGAAARNAAAHRGVWMRRADASAERHAFTAGRRPCDAALYLIYQQIGVTEAFQWRFFICQKSKSHPMPESSITRRARSCRLRMRRFSARQAGNRSGAPTMSPQRAKPKTSHVRWLRAEPAQRLRCAIFVCATRLLTFSHGRSARKKIDRYDDEAIRRRKLCFQT